METSISKNFKMEGKESLRKLFLDLGCEIENDAILDKCKYFQDIYCNFSTITSKSFLKIMSYLDLPGSRYSSKT